jgi:hypothetical protein
MAADQHHDAQSNSSNAERRGSGSGLSEADIPSPVFGAWRVITSRAPDSEATDATNGLGTEEGGFSSFSAAKNALGSPGEGNVYDHIVEQSQIGRSGFSSAQINNPENLNPVLSELNQLKANYYSSIRPFTGGQTERDWLNGQSFASQWNFGMGVTEDIWNGVIR